MYMREGEFRIWEPLFHTIQKMSFLYMILFLLV